MGMKLLESIVTRNAIINRDYTLIKNHGRFLLPTQGCLGMDGAALVRVYYRRFCRLRPFMSKRAMVRATYTDYIRYKFKTEEYALKRSLVLEGNDVPMVGDWEDSTKKTFQFVLKSVSYIPETSTNKYDVARDNTACRQIMKNLLGVEYEKDNMIQRSGNRADIYKDLRIEFNHLKDLENLNDKKSITQKGLGNFDRCLVLLNESLGTRL